MPIQSATAAVALVASQTGVWTVVHAGELIAEHQLTSISTFEVESAATVRAEHRLTGAADWEVASSGDVNVEIALTATAHWAISGEAAATAVTNVSQAASILVSHSAHVEVAIDVSHGQVLSVAHRSVIRAKDRVNEALPVWSFEPNWEGGNLETLEWMTDILRSPTGAEQRRSLRPFPRRTFEFSIALQGADRAFFNNLIFAHGAHDWYLPMWHDAHSLDADVPFENFFLPCSTAAGNFEVGELLLVTQGDSRKYDLVEVLSLSSEGINVFEPVDNAWQAGTQIYPVRLARLTEQPTPRRESNSTITSQIRFRLAEVSKGAATFDGLDIYRDAYVLSIPPDDRETLDTGYERILEELDNLTAIPIIYDSAALAFPVQKHSWTLNGRAEHKSFISLIYALRGKAQPIWLPTYFEDFNLADDVAVGDTFLRVKNVGYTATGGPRESRRDIAIELLDGTRIYRRIIASSVVGDEEVLAVDSPLPAFAISMVARISLMALSRLNQDQIEINHLTDVEGVSRVVATFRNAPDLRQPNPGI